MIRLHGMLAILVLAAASNSYDIKRCIVDSPECVCCYVDDGAWDPGGTLLHVARQTLGTKESCVSNGGKPYYQMTLGCNSREEAQASAASKWSAPRTAWCSEAIAYWHREAHLPYANGYQSPWHSAWLITNTTKLRAWYQTAGSLPEEERKAYWISGSDLDYAAFDPGINAPLPGAYQQLMGWDGTEWMGSGNAHSQLVEETTIHRDQNGTVFRIDVRVIEGNAGNGLVRNSKVYTDIMRYTVDGTEFIGTNRKIRGWGIDLPTPYVKQPPKLDLDKLKYIDHPDLIAPLIKYGPPLPDPVDPLVERWVDYARATSERPVRVTCDSAAARGLEQGLPDPARGTVWKIGGKGRLDEAVVVTVEFPLPYPLEIEALTLVFAGADVPREIGIATVDAADRASRVQTVTPAALVAERGAPRSTVLRIELDGEPRAGVQSLHIEFPAGALTREIAVQGLQVNASHGPEDSDDNP